MTTQSFLRDLTPYLKLYQTNDTASIQSAWIVLGPQSFIWGFLIKKRKIWVNLIKIKQGNMPHTDMGNYQFEKDSKSKQEQLHFNIQNHNNYQFEKKESKSKP